MLERRGSMSAVKMRDINGKVYDATVEQFKSYLFSPSCFWSEGLLLSTILLSGTDIASPMLMGGLTGASIASCFTTLSNTIVKTRKFANGYKRELLKQTDEYNECLSLYERYVDKIAEFIRYIGLTDSLDVGMIYMNLLYGGILSCTDSFDYHKYERDIDICPELWGARVSSGTGVCRHIASNLVDVYKELGFTASYLSVKGCDGSTKSILVDRLLPTKPVHAVVSVGDRYGKYIIDPTWKTVAQFGKDEAFAPIIWGKKSTPIYHINYNEFIDRDKKVSYDDFAILREMPNARFRKGYVTSAAMDAYNYLATHERLVRDFSLYLKSDVRRIALLEKRISSYRDCIPTTVEVKRLEKKLR